METREASPAQLLIKIESFSSLSKNGIQKYESGEFKAGDYKWRLIIHPDGLNKSENEDNHISVYVAIVKSSSMTVGWEVNAIFSIFLYNQILDNYLCFQGKIRRFSAMKSQWGFSKFISKKSLRDPSNGFLVDDNCVFGAEVFAMEKTQRVTERVSVLKFSGPYKRDWKILQFSKLGKLWTSEEFPAGDLEWKFVLYPNGIGSEVDRSVSVFVESVDSKSFASNERVKADYCIRIRNQLNDKHRSISLTNWFTSSEPKWGWPDFIPLADIRDPNKGFIVNDCCFVEIEIYVKAAVYADGAE